MRGTVIVVIGLVAACTHTTTPDTFVRMEQTECLGRCPVYTVTLYRDGTVRYEGRENVPVGTRWRTIEPREVVRLMQMVDQIPAWQCPSDRIVTDHPASIVTVSRNGQRRRIVHDHGDPCAPPTMDALELDIDAAAGTPHILKSE